MQGIDQEHSVTMLDQGAEMEASIADEQRFHPARDLASSSLLAASIPSRRQWDSKLSRTIVLQSVHLYVLQR